MGMVRAMPRVVMSGPKRTTLLAQQKSEITVPIMAFRVISARADLLGHEKGSRPVQCKIKNIGSSRNMLNRPTKPRKYENLKLSSYSGVIRLFSRTA